MLLSRSLLLVSAVLQGTIALTFGLTFAGLWKGFRRPTARSWATAWLMYAAGVFNTALGTGTGLFRGLPVWVQAVVSLPLIVGVLMFRSGTDALVEPDRPSPYARALIACAIVGPLVVLVRVVASLAGIDPSIPNFQFPRLVMAGAYFWTAWPLLRLTKPQRREGFDFLALALTLLATRMLFALGYEVWQMALGAGGQPESLVLTLVQVCLLIVFGVAITIVLIQPEHDEAVRAAQAISAATDELRASEQRFRFVVEHSSDVQMIVDAGRRIRYVAPSSAHLLGLAPPAIEGRDLLDVVHPDDREMAVAAIDRAWADADRRALPISVRIQHPEGAWLSFEINGEFVGERGAPDATMVLSLRDVTTQRRLEAELLRTNRLDALGRMAGGIAHDFNNTLSAINGGTELAAFELPTDSPALHYLDIIRAASVRGEALVRQLLTFARRLPTNVERFDVRDRLKSIEGIVRMLAGRTVQLEIDAYPQPLYVSANPSQFDHAIINLVANARDAMPYDGRIRIQPGLVPASAVAPSGAPSLVRVVVEDNGVGIPPAVLDRIFEPFFTTKDVGQGVGLGLASAYGFARQAGGNLTVESTEGVGTRFALDLPLDVEARIADV